MTDREHPITLGATGAICLTPGAVRSYATWARIPIAEAHDELRALLAEARRLPQDARTGAERWRIRRRATRLDIEAHVVRQDDGSPLVPYVFAREIRGSAELHRRRQSPYRDDA